MRVRRFLVIASVLMVGYVSVAGCGDDDATVPDVGDTGTGDTSKPDTSSNDTSTVDTSPPFDGNAGDARSPEYTGSTCTSAAQCYGDHIDAASLLGGPAVCLDKVTDGYCTHECTADTDCCAVPGECRTALKQVCASFENTNKKYCFLSCEDADIKAANDAGLNDAGTDGNDYCHKNMSTQLGCRSTGGGGGNRKVCLPTGGAPNDGGTDAADASDAADAADGDGG